MKKSENKNIVTLQILVKTMKAKKIELDVDFIGTQESTLTKEEEKAISEFIRSQKSRLRSASKIKKKLKV